MADFEIDEGTPKPGRVAPTVSAMPPEASPATPGGVGAKPARGVASWVFADHLVTHNQDMQGIRLFFGFAGALAWFLCYWIVKFAVGPWFGEWSHVVAFAAIGVLGWRFWLMHSAWRAATAARRLAYGLPTTDQPGDPQSPALMHPALRWLLAAPRWTQRALAAHAERIVLDLPAINAGEEIVGRIGPGADGVTLAEAQSPVAVLDALELLGVTERIPGSEPLRIRIRDQVRDRLFPPVKKPTKAEHGMFANVSR